MIENILNGAKKILIWGKDIDSKYLFCNEAAAEAAGLDSPSQVVGKTDDDLFWRQYADFYRSCNRSVMQGEIYLNQLCPFVSALKSNITLLSTETVLQDKSGYAKGVIGHAIDVTGFHVRKNSPYYFKKNIFYLGEHFSDAYFTKNEFEVFKELLLGSSIEKMSLKLTDSVKTIQSHIKNIGRKLQCSHQSEIIPTAIKYGLSHVLSDIDLSISSSAEKSNGPHLTQRQIDCLIHLVKGKTIKQIARALHLSAKTIEHYLDTIKSKLNAQDRSTLIEQALQLAAIRERL